MLLDGIHDDLAMLDVLLGQNRQHIDQRLAVVRQIHQTGQVLLGELLVLFLLVVHGALGSLGKFTGWLVGVWLVVFVCLACEKCVRICVTRLSRLEYELLGFAKRLRDQKDVLTRRKAKRK